MATSFWVYENIPNNHARIHASYCPYCNSGHGIHEYPGQGPTSWWHGPYNTYTQARQKAINTNKPYKDCGFCHPQL